MPVEAHIKEHPAWFHRFDVSWTPTVLLMDPDGKEQYRIEGYLPKPEFQAELRMGLARLAFKAKKWSDAEQAYADVVEHFPDSKVAPEARYWTGVSQYQRTRDPAILAQTGKILAEKYAGTVWAEKGSVWLT